MPTSILQQLPRHLAKLAIATVVVAAGLAWFHTGKATAGDQTPLAPPAPVVEVTTLQPTEIRTWHTFSGRLAPVDSAEIKPLVSGTIQQVLFTEGQVVAKGSPLFVIDPRPHEATVQRAEAQLATAQSRASLAADEHARAEKMLASRVLSQSLYDSAASNLQVAEAAVQEAESALSQARLNLEYAHITAPISGRIGRAELTVGNVVEAGANAPVLTSIVADDRFYVEFSVNEQLYIQSVRSTREQQDMPVELTLAEDTAVVYHGNIHAFDNHLDTASGTIRARALFANTDGALTAGMYANVRLGSAETISALLVPERAIGTNQSKKFVYVVGADNVVQYREVTLSEQYEGHRVVAEGLAAGDQVVVNGLSRVSPNTTVDPVQVAPVLQELAQQ